MGSRGLTMPDALLPGVVNCAAASASISEFGTSSMVDMFGESAGRDGRATCNQNVCRLRALSGTAVPRKAVFMLYVGVLKSH